MAGAGRPAGTRPGARPGLRAGAGRGPGARWRRRIAGLPAVLSTAAALAAGPGAAPAQAATATLGSTAVGPSTDSDDSNHLNASRYVTGASTAGGLSFSIYATYTAEDTPTPPRGRRRPGR
ncbi:hypothetical protein [Streptomyces sp. CB01881]|uniref:hypothetical protein n=1 Tax=Streptomyces sp. CB01881 TaxID=2078691 RepID=UPI000CDC07F9|nr:hypothetical protein [Streptomyces sp. CB01881]AUY49596.1 hypothetical protein C2142_12385 [Streptomyces sp. CB01881]TYC72991.1 hypothetical protein EH183_12390 [Streptomyces sp. CB01881]